MQAHEILVRVLFYFSPYMPFPYAGLCTFCMYMLYSYCIYSIHTVLFLIWYTKYSYKSTVQNLCACVRVIQLAKNLNIINQAALHAWCFMATVAVVYYTKQCPPAYFSFFASALLCWRKDDLIMTELVYLYVSTCSICSRLVQCILQTTRCVGSRVAKFSRL